MSKPTKEERIKATSQEMVALGRTLRFGTVVEARLAFRNAAARPALHIERSKPTILSAAFVFDYTSMVASGKPVANTDMPRFNTQKKRAYAQLVLEEVGLVTLRALFRDLEGSPQHVVNLLRPFTNLSDAQLEEIVKTTSTI